MFANLHFDLPDGSALNVEIRCALAAGASARDREQALKHVERMLVTFLQQTVFVFPLTGNFFGPALIFKYPVFGFNGNICVYKRSAA